MEPLLADLERRDARVAAELARVEAEQAELEELRAHAAAAQAFLADAPDRIASFARAEETAKRAAAALRAPPEEERDDAAIAAAEAQVARAREHQDALTHDTAAWRAIAERLCAQAGAADLEATLAWASHRRGALLVERTNLARERDAIVREASEYLGSVLGEPFALTSVFGLRDRLT